MTVVDFSAFVERLAQVSGEVILPFFRSAIRADDKSGGGVFDPVTEADRGAEAAMRAAIAARFPEHGVLGEEYGEDRPEAEFVWVLDPIDGTRAFIAGLPVWTTLIGLRFQGEPVLGSIGQPYVGEIYIGHAGGSRLMSGGEERPLAVRKSLPLNSAIIATTDPHACFDRPEMGAWRELRGLVRLVRLGCDAYAYAMVAAGTVDLVVEAGLKSWDIEAAIPVIAGAGGFTTDWTGAAVGAHGGRVAIAGDRACLDEALVALSAVGV